MGLVDIVKMVPAEIIAGWFYFKKRFEQENVFYEVGKEIFPASAENIKWVLVYGFLEDERVFSHLPYENNLRFKYDTTQDIGKSSLELEKFVKDNKKGNLPMGIKARSMGGIIARKALLEGYLTSEDIQVLWTIGTPHKGSFMAGVGYLIIKSCRQMFPGSKFMKGLQKQVLPSGIHYINYHGRADLLGGCAWDNEKVENYLIPGARGHLGTLENEKSMKLKIGESSILS